MTNPVASRPPPSRWWYAFAAFLVLCGGVLMAAFMVPRILAMPDQLKQVVVPGTATLEVSKPASFTIFHERLSVVDGEVFRSGPVDGLRVKVLAPDGTSLTVSPASVGSRYAIGGRSGEAILSFFADRAGTYQIVGAYKKDKPGPRLVLAIGSGFLRDLLTTILGALGFMSAGVVSGGLVAALTWRKRRAARHALSVTD